MQSPSLSKLLLPLLSLAGCVSYPPLEVVESVDLPRYLGTWYEIGSFPAWFQDGCHCSTAEYSPGQDEPIAVLNSCRRDSADGELDTADGVARPLDPSSNARLEVSFARPFWGDYWIIDLDEQDYGWVVVGTPSREYLWILSRTPTMDEALLQELIDRAAAKGFDMSRLLRTDQSCWSAATADSATRVRITAEEAEAHGLPPFDFSLDTAGTPMLASPFPDQGEYLTVSGPPGGPQLVRFVSPPGRVDGAAALEPFLRTVFSHVGEDPFVPGAAVEVELAGASRSALPFVTSQSMARTAWCAVLLDPSPAAGGPQLVALVGIGSSGEPDCAVPLANPQLSIVLESLRLE